MKIDLSQFDGMTPGPWKATAGDSVVSIHSMDGSGICATTSKPYWKKHDGVEIANARAIAALPDLIAELKRAYAAIEIAREYLDKKLDYNSAPFGDYVPNDAMKCLQEINEAMEKR